VNNTTYGSDTDSHTAAHRPPPGRHQSAQIDAGVRAPGPANSPLLLRSSGHPGIQVIWPRMHERASRIGGRSTTQAPIKIDRGSSVRGGPPLLCVFGAQRDQVALGMPCVGDLHEGDRLSVCAAALAASLTAPIRQAVYDIELHHFAETVSLVDQIQESGAPVWVVHDLHAKGPLSAVGCRRVVKVPVRLDDPWPHNIDDVGTHPFSTPRVRRGKGVADLRHTASAPGYA
jgi:hypothetical protein